MHNYTYTREPGMIRCLKKTEYNRTHDWHRARGNIGKEKICGEDEWRMSDRRVIVKIASLSETSLDLYLAKARKDTIKHGSRLNALIAERDKRDVSIGGVKRLADGRKAFKTNGSPTYTRPYHRNRSREVGRGGR